VGTRHRPVTFCCHKESWTSKALDHVTRRPLNSALREGSVQGSK